MIEFMIVDDDKAIVNVLQRIINQHELGEVVGTAYDGIGAEQLALELMPQVMLVDLLLPGQDGITLVSRLRDACPHTRFVMLSQVNDKHMVGDAYSNGIDFFIHKPINAIEVVTVIRRVTELVRLKKAFETIESTARVLAGGRADGPRGMAEASYKPKLKQVLTDIGIIGDLSSRDITAICSLVHENPAMKRAPEELQLADLLKALQHRYHEETGVQTDSKTIEMRIRRGLAKALRNLAALGIEDYANDRFVLYSTSLFDYADIKAEMDCLRGKSPNGGKVNIRGFIRRLILMTDSDGFDF